MAIAKKPRIFILGVSGFLGFRLALHLRKNFSITGGYFENPISLPDCHFFPVHYRDYDSLETQIKALRPDFTIMAAGITDTKYISDNVKMAEAINALLPLSFALASQKNHSKNIHLSCSEVFEGHQGNYSEADRATAIDKIYRWKVEAETYIRAQTNDNTIVRFGRVMGLGIPYRLNRFDRMRKKFANGEEVHVADKIFHTYMSTNRFCEAIEAILLDHFPPKNRIIHLPGVNANEVQALEALANSFQYNKKLIHPIAELHEKYDFTLNGDTFTQAHKNWQRDASLEAIYESIKIEMRPGISSVKKEQTISQNP